MDTFLHRVGKPVGRVAAAERVYEPEVVGGLWHGQDMDQILMLTGVTGACPDCADERILVAVDEHGSEFCCTDCDAAVLLLEVVATSFPELRRSA